MYLLEVYFASAYVITNRSVVMLVWIAIIAGYKIIYRNNG